MKPRLLVIELHHFGDAVLSIPFLQAAAVRYEVTVYCTPAVAKMLKEFLPHITVIEAATGWLGRFRQAWQFRQVPPETTVCAWSDARAALIARLSGARIRVGFPTAKRNFYAPEKPWRKRRLHVGRAIEIFAHMVGLPLLTLPVWRKSHMDSHLSNWERLADALGLALRLETPWFEIPSKPPEKLSSLVQNQGGELIFGMHAGGRLPTKRWALENFQRLLEKLAEWEKPTVILCPPHEKSPKPVNGKQLALETRSHTELAQSLQCIDVLICNDSYPAHLAAALGKTVFAIFGSGEPAWFSPWQNAQNVIRTPSCPHTPCIDRCIMPSTICLESVSVEQVERRLRGVLNQR